MRARIVILSCFLLAPSFAAQDFQVLFEGNLLGVQVARDPLGRLIVAGTAGAIAPDRNDFPLLYPPCNASEACAPLEPRQEDIYLAVLSADGSSKIWERFIGGSDRDYFRKLIVGPDGAIYILAQTHSDDFEDGETPHGDAGVIVKVDLEGVTEFAVYPVEGDKYSLSDILLDQGGNLLFTGFYNFPEGRLFTGRLSAADNSVQLSRHALGGGFLSIDAEGNVIITAAVSVPPDGYQPIVTTENALQSAARPASCGSGLVSLPCLHQFVAKLRPDLSELVFATYLTGNGGTTPSGPAVALGDGSLLVSGSTTATDYPVTTGAFISEYPSKVPLGLQGARQDSSAFVSILSGDGSKLLNSTFVGGEGVASVYSISVAESTVLLRGFTTSPFPGLDPWSSEPVPPTDFEITYDLQTGALQDGRSRPDLLLNNERASVFPAGDSLYAVNTFSEWSGDSTPGLVAAATDPDLTKHYVVLRRLSASK